MTDAYRILVTGSREWDDRDAIWWELKRLADEHNPDRLVIVHGACRRGADAMAAAYGSLYGIRTEPHPANWARHGKAAGFRRNAEMAELGAEVCLAFIRDGSRGATHCAETARKAGIPVRYFRA